MISAVNKSQAKLLPHGENEKQGNKEVTSRRVKDEDQALHTQGSQTGRHEKNQGTRLGGEKMRGFNREGRREQTSGHARLGARGTELSEQWSGVTVDFPVNRGLANHIPQADRAQHLVLCL